MCWFCWLGWCTLWKHQWCFPWEMWWSLGKVHGSRKCFIVLFSYLEVTCAELEDFVELCGLWGWRSQMCQHSRWQIPQGMESSTLELKGTPFARCYQTCRRGIVPMLEAAQGVQLQCILIITLGNISCFILLLSFCLILPNTANLC